MKREELIKAIYDDGDMWSCPHNCECEDNPLELDECMKCSENQLAEYENSIRADERRKVLEEVKNKAQNLIHPEYDERDEFYNYGAEAVIAIIEELEER